jgi:predicted amidohydrolase/nicotinic acid mononucleotide adenylyltransferase
MNSEKRLIVYGGAFNPPTPAHISAIRRLSSLDGELVLLPSGADFVRKWKPGQQVLPDIARLELLDSALKNAGIRNATVDCLAMEKNLCTYDALARLREKYAAAEAWFVIGEDKLDELPRWAHARALVRSTRFVLLNYQKNGEDELDIPGLDDRVRIFHVKLPAGTEDTHATDIRGLMRAHSAAALETEAGRYMAAYPGCLRVSACAPRAYPGFPEKNADAIIGCMNATDGDILVFPELSVSGYACGSFAENSFLDACEAAAARIAAATKATGQLVFVGCPVRVGGGLYNCAVAAINGEVLAVIPKSHAAKSDVSKERHSFASGAEAAEKTAFFAGREAPFGVDLLLRSARGCAAVGVEIGDDSGASVSPSLRHCAAGANVIVNLAVGFDSPADARGRRDALKALSERGLCAYVHASCADKGAPGMSFDGKLMIALSGEVLAEKTHSVSGAGDAGISADIDLSMPEADRRRAPGFFEGCAGYRSVAYDQLTFRFPPRSAGQTFLPGGKCSDLRDFLMFYNTRYGFDGKKLRVMAAEAFGVQHISDIDRDMRLFF